jgi:hypothetical protein
MYLPTANILRLCSVSESLACGQCGWRIAAKNRKVTLICGAKNFKEGSHWNFKALEHTRRPTFPWGCVSSSSCHVAVYVLCLTRHNRIFSAGLVIPDVSKDRRPLILKGLRSRRGLWVLLVKKKKKCRPNRGRYGWGVVCIFETSETSTLRHCATSQKPRIPNPLPNCLTSVSRLEKDAAVCVVRTRHIKAWSWLEDSCNCI